MSNPGYAKDQLSDPRAKEVLARNPLVAEFAEWYGRLRQRNTDSRYEHLAHTSANGLEGEFHEDCHWCNLDVYERENPPELLIF